MATRVVLSMNWVSAVTCELRYEKQIAGRKVETGMITLTADVDQIAAQGYAFGLAVALRKQLMAWQPSLPLDL